MVDLQQYPEKEKRSELGSFVLVELPVLQIPGEIEIASISGDIRQSLPPVLKQLSAKERLIGNEFNDLVKKRLTEKVAKNYPNLNIFAMDFYFDLLLRDKIYPWNFSGTVAVEKRLPGLSSIGDREGMSLLDINDFISNNRKDILEKILLHNPTIDRAKLGSVELRLPTIAEMIALDGLGYKTLCPKPIWTSTKIEMEMGKEKVNLIWRPKAYSNQEIDYARPNRPYTGAEFIVLAKFNRPVSRSDS